MNRRDWFRRVALIATGVVAADQLELLERLTWTRTLFPGADLAPEIFRLEKNPALSIWGGSFEYWYRRISVNRVDIETTAEIRSAIASYPEGWERAFRIDHEDGNR